MKRPTPKRTPVLPKILVFLARKGEANKWQMKKELKVSYSNVYNTIDSLLKEKSITVSKTIQSKKNLKIDVDFYQLTHSGLLATLIYTEAWEHIDEIARTQKYKFSFVFGKWSFYVEEGQRSEALTRLRHAVGYFYKYVPRSEITGLTEIIPFTDKTPLEYLEDAEKRLPKEMLPALNALFNPIDEFEKIFLFWPYVGSLLEPLKPTTSPELRKWFAALHKDPELRTKTIEFFNGEEQSREFWLKEFRSVKEWFETLP